MQCSACGQVFAPVTDSQLAAGSPGISAAAELNQGSTLIQSANPFEDTASYEGPAVSSDNLVSGERLGDYLIEGEIARGGMGVVYRATQVSLKRPVALKIILSSRLAGEEQVRRFRSEATAAAKFDHRGVVPVYEVDQIGGQHFFSMGLIEGGTLSKLAADAPLKTRRAAQLVHEIAAAVHYAHTRNIVHRDLKPDNVLLDRDGQPKITDFGLAKDLAGEAPGMTVSDAVMGTPSYMAPEQALGRVAEVGPLADVYALGGILYYLLTQKPPFHGSSLPETLRQVVEEEPIAPQKLNPQIDANLQTICLKCLRKDINRRYASAAALGDELQRWLENRPILARPAGIRERVGLWCRRHPLRAGVIAGVVLMLCVLSLILFDARLRRIALAKNNLEKQASTAVAALSIARGDSVQFALTSLKQFPDDLVLQLLGKQFTAAAEQDRLGFAYGLAEYGDVRVHHLVDQVESVSSDESSNLVDFLQLARDESVAAMVDKAEACNSNSSWNSKAHLAVLCLQLGEVSVVAEMLKAFPNDEETQEFDPIQRSVFIREFSDWCGHPEKVLPIVCGTTDPELRSGMCLALAEIESPSEDAKNLWDGTLSDWYLNSPDSGTHGAARLVRVRWGLGVPEIIATELPADQLSWWETSSGLTLARIQPGDVIGEKGRIEVENEFWLSDREVTVGLYAEFIKDMDYSGTKPEKWSQLERIAGRSLSELNYPLRDVSWYDACMFCNWLSEQHGLPGCYLIEPRRKQSRDRYRVKHLQDSAGFRLPTEDEWEYACRAKTTTRFFYGHADAWLLRYGCYQKNSADFPVSSARFLCNPWGLYDMHGNFWEWCWDRNDASNRVSRGGSFEDASGYCRSSSRIAGHAAAGSIYVGFRVAANLPGKSN